MFAPRVVAAVLGLALLGGAQDGGAATNGAVAPAAGSSPDPSADLQRGIAGLMAFAKNLTLTPKAVAGADGSATAGVEYAYSRPFLNFVGGTELDLYFESRGTFVAEPELTPETRLSHKLRLTVIDLLAASQQDDFQQRRDADGVNWRRRAVLPDAQQKNLRALYRTWASQPAGTPSRADALAKLQMASVAAGIGELTVDEATSSIAELDAYQKEPQRSRPFLSFELNGGAETNQEFTRNQWVGGAEVRGKWGLPAVPLDWVLTAIRGYGEKDVVDYRNYDGGLYFWAGVDLVDASDDEARTALTDDSQFARLGVGAYYRGELLSVMIDGQKQAVGLELEWRFYQEFDAPSAIEAADLGEMSWFRGTLLFPGNALLEYTDGRQPLDLTGGSQLFVGWRYSF
jgi:hypothetical protein